MLSLLKYIAQLPAEKPDVAHRPRANRRSTALFNTPSPLFDVHSRSSKHLRQFKFVTIGFIPTVLSTESFASKLPEQTRHTKYVIEKTYLSLVEELLTFVTVTAQHAEKHNQGTTGKFWRALLHRIYHLIDKVNELLPPNVFINVIRRLLHNSNATVRRKSMDLLNTKLGQSKAIADQVLEACITVFTNKNENSQVSSNAILCLGEVCAGLKASTISYFPQFMPSLLSLLEKTGHHRNVVMLLCAVVTVHKVTETLPNFLSPYLVQILLRTLQSVIIIITIIIIIIIIINLIIHIIMTALRTVLYRRYCEPELLDQIESDVINSFCELIMKMSEATFRPVFLK
ncbi:hypothetical protein QZH41_007853, partial [Actinostola sp. cb2023]